MTIKIKVEKYDLLEMLEDRLKFWTEDKTELLLFRKMYESYIDGGVFDGGVFDEGDFSVKELVDNDYVNWCSVIEDGEPEFEDILSIYKKDGIGDMSCDKTNNGYNYIEAVDDEEQPTAILVRS